MATSYQAAVPEWRRRAEERTVNRSNGRELPVDKWLLIIVLALTLFGLVMVYSASAMLAQRKYGTQFYSLIRQSIWAAIGLVGMAIAIRIDYRFYKHPAVAVGLICVSVLLLGAVFMFPPINKAHRWIRYDQLSLQPSEIAKFALVVFISFFFERRADRIADLLRTFLPAALVASVIVVLVGAEPDLGTAISIGLVFVVMSFAAGIPARFVAGIGALAVPALIGMMVFVPWRLQRFFDFLAAWKDPTESSYQVSQSLIAIGSGGSTGLGLAQGKQKLFYLPAPETDFIFAVVGEELGLVGAVAVLAVFAALAWRGIRSARLAPDVFGQSLAVGLTTMIVAQAFFNLSVAISLLPAKGIPLPFVSYGGSSLAINLVAAGVLLNVSKHTSESWH